VRSLRLGLDGRGITGEDTLDVPDADAARVFQRAFDASKLRGVAFAVRFHLHPDVDAELDLGGTAVSMELRSGEIWVFRHDGRAELTLEPSVYLEGGRLAPRVTKQVVLTSAATDASTRIGWTISKAQDTPSNIRDFVADDTTPD
jgi:uncharacterized heparinase superfamily protein